MGDFEAAYGAAITAAAFSDTGTLAVALGDGCIRLIGADRRVQTTEAHDGAVLSLSLDIDGKGFVSGGDDGRVVCTTAEGSMVSLLSAPGKHIDVLAVSRTAKARAVAVGREVTLFDGGGATVAQMSDHPSTVTGLAFNSKGKRLAVSHYGGVSLWWTMSPGAGPQRLNWRGSHIGVTWSPDGAYLMTSMQECELHGWRLKDNEDVAMRGYSAKVRSMDWLAKPSWLVTAGAECVIGWPFAGAGPQGKTPAELCQGTGGIVSQVAVHPKLPLVAAGFDNGVVAVCRLPNAPSDEVFDIRPADGRRITALAWSRDGTQLVAGNDIGTLSLFDLAAASV
jgi:WD40 repeat protein